MAGEVFFNKEKIKDEELEARRREAQLAMESPQHKALRQEQEKLIQRREEGKRLIAEERARHAAELAKKQAAQAELDRLAKDRRELENLRRHQKFEAKKNLIEDLKSDATVGLSPIRTLSDDMSRLVNQDGLSIRQRPILNPEKKVIYRQGQTINENQKSNRKVAIATTTIVLLIILTGGVSFYLNQKQPANNTEIVVPASRPLIFSEKNLSFDVGTKPSLIIYSTINTLISMGGANNTITNLQMYVSATTSGQVKTKNIGLNDFLNRTKMALPIDFTRYLGENFMIGFYQGPTAPKMFLILTVNEKDYAKSWILKNEMTLLAITLAPFHSDKNFLNELSGQKIIDVTIKNKDARLVKDRQDQTIALYSWLDPQTLLIAQDEPSFTKIIDAFNTPAPLN